MFENIILYYMAHLYNVRNILFLVTSIHLCVFEVRFYMRRYMFAKLDENIATI